MKTIKLKYWRSTYKQKFIFYIDIILIFTITRELALSIIRVALSSLLFFIPSLSNAATNYDFSPSKCTAWSEPAISKDYIYSFTITVPIGFNGVQVYFLATSLNHVNHDNVDELVELIINGRKMKFAAQGVADSVLIKPQNPDDTRFLLQAAGTGSLSYGPNLIIPTAGTKHAKDFILKHCTD